MKKKYVSMKKKYTSMKKKGCKYEKKSMQAWKKVCKHVCKKYANHSDNVKAHGAI